MSGPVTDLSAFEAALQRVHVWAYPLLLARRLRRNMTSAQPDERSAAAPLGHMGHQRRLSDPGYRVGVAPNVDTLYSVAWVDLAEGPYRLDLPPVRDRYYTVQVGYADSTSVAVGVRTHGEQLPPVVVRRSGSPLPPAPADTVYLESPTRFAMFALRILVEGDSGEDRSVVRALQDRVALRAWTSMGWAVPEEPAPGPGAPAGEPAGIAGPSGGVEQWLALVDEVVRDLDPAHVPALVRADLELLTRGCHRAAGADTPAPRWWDDALELADRRVAESVRAVGTSMNGWTVNLRGCDFGEDWALRAAVAHSQIYINPVQEAVYPVAELDDQGRPLTGDQQYELLFAPGELPPVRYFWSLTMYHARGLLVDNPVRRYSVGDRTPGLRPAEDGSLTVRISSEAQDVAQEDGGSVWLPAPAGGFRLMLRLYGPLREVLEGSWAPPTVRRV